MASADEIWWDLPGPSRFARRIAEAALDPGRCVVGLSLPGAPVPGMFDAVGRILRDRSSRWVIQPGFPGGLSGRTPMKALAAAAGVDTVGLNRAADFVWHPELSEAVFLIEVVRPEDWPKWALFARAVEGELSRGGQFSTPSVILTAPRGRSPAETEAMLGRQPIRWHGSVSRLDTRLFVERIRPTVADDLLSRLATETIVELAGWDRVLASGLAVEDVGTQVYPLDALRALLPGWTRDHPSWDNALVDMWEGMPFPHTLSLMASGREDHRRIVETRLWSARTRVIFPFLEQLRHAYIRKYDRTLSRALPYEKPAGNSVKLLHRTVDLEISHIRKILHGHLGRDSDDAILLEAMNSLRHALAHVDRTDHQTITLASELWEDLAHTFPGECDGWDWPRCGQKLVVLVGPPGAGKSSWARANHPAEDIVSSDAIRKELYGDETFQGDPVPVFMRLRRMVTDRLAAGRSAVVDATNLKRDDRVANALLAPPDIAVQYVVIDRAFADKRRDGGWRNERGIIEKLGAQFDEALLDILAGDGIPNIEVVVPPLGGASVVEETAARLRAGMTAAA
ncbi:ATP-binding protein [Roseomonas sp. E05]|uniref:ATP-binding protein n=1 Tax=Roseomonas sp. E05 TaxID=3046310 RepID=UPI0024B96077|nr:ATP-binding protein [Roseomonas sp. E05]MDJ0388288.1 ATP-binding protein [Roseomonas sp. E05]